jgi:hypothetical protein
MPDDPTVAERAVVIQLLDRKRAAMPAELYAAIREGLTPSEIDAAVARLAESGVIRQDEYGALRTTSALRHLDTLGLICI